MFDGVTLPLHFFIMTTHPRRGRGSWAFLAGKKGLDVAGNESTHLCGLLVLLNTLSFPMKNLFLYRRRVVPGDNWDFFHPENSKKIIMERVTDHTSWLDAASPLSSHHIFASCRAQPPLCLFVS
jgi:hypothetical protein